MTINVETLQIAKQSGVGGSSGGSSQEIIKRIEELEKKQLNIFNQFTEEFINDNYIDLDKTTAIISTKCILPRQLKNGITENFDNDLNLDLDFTNNIACINGKVELAYPNSLDGVFVTNYYDVPNTKSFIFNPKEIMPLEISKNNEKDYQESNIWFVSGIDNFGKLWVFDSDIKTSLRNPSIYLTIFNKDMTIYKHRVLTDIVLKIAYEYLCPGGELFFDDNNICLLAFNSLLSRKITNEPIANTDNWRYSQAVVTCDENGNMIDVIFEEVTTAFSSTSTKGQNPSLNPQCCFISSSKLLICKTKSAIMSCSYSYGSYCDDGYVVLEYDSGKKIKELSSYSIDYGRFGAFSRGANNYTSIPNTQHFLKYKNSIYRIFIHDFLGSYYNYRSTESKILCTRFNLYSDSNIHTNIILKGDNLVTQGPASGALSGTYFDKKNNILYNFTPLTYKSPTIMVTKYKIDLDKMEYTLIDSNSLKLIKPTTYCKNPCLNTRFRVVDDGKHLHLIYISEDDSVICNSLRYMCIDYDLNVVVEDTLIYCAFAPNQNVEYFEMYERNGKMIVLFSMFYKAERTVENPKIEEYGIKIIEIDKVNNNSIEYYYSTDKELYWQKIIPGELITKLESFDKIKIRSYLRSSTGNKSPEIDSFTIQSYSTNNAEFRKSEFVSKTIPSVVNSGKGILTADYELNDGLIEWYISFDGGNNYTKTNLNEEFMYNFITTPDFRVKAELYVTDSSVKLPIIRSYTIKTNSMVLHSDIEEVQINIMKTNFKLDTFMNASKNGLYKMNIEVFNNNNFIDFSKSDCLHSITGGYVYGNFAITKSDVINQNIRYLLITTDEELPNINSSIKYFVSVDNGVNFEEIVPNVKKYIDSTNIIKDKTELVFKIVFNDGAALSALGWAWD